MYSKKGEKSGHNKLKERDVREIREEGAKGTCRKSLAARYGVCLSQIYYIIARKTWSHLE
jgi:hypothetical protein